MSRRQKGIELTSREWIFILLLVLAFGFYLGEQTRDEGPVAEPDAEILEATVPAAAAPRRQRDGDYVRVERIVDGDTIQLETGETVRLLGINTPERDQPFYDDAVAFARESLLNQPVLVETDAEPQDRYGRTLGYLFLEDGTFINLEIVRRGYAPVWIIPPNVRYTEEFARAEAEARERGAGIWAASDAPLQIAAIEADPPGRDDERLNEETVTIRNVGRAAVDLEGFRLIDRSNETYIFPDVTLSPGREVVVHAGSGRDRGGNLYWGLTRPVWNNGGDTAFLRDAANNIVDVYSYGDDAP